MYVGGRRLNSEKSKRGVHGGRGVIVSWMVVVRRAMDSRTPTNAGTEGRGLKPFCAHPLHFHHPLRFETPRTPELSCHAGTFPFPVRRGEGMFQRMGEEGELTIPFRTGPTLSDIVSIQTRSHPTHSDPIRFNPIQSDPTQSAPFRSDPLLSRYVLRFFSQIISRFIFVYTNKKNTGAEGVWFQQQQQDCLSHIPNRFFLSWSSAAPGRFFSRFFSSFVFASFALPILFPPFFSPICFPDMIPPVLVHF